MTTEAEKPGRQRYAWETSALVLSASGLVREARRLPSTTSKLCPTNVPFDPGTDSEGKLMTLRKGKVYDILLGEKEESGT